MGKFCPSEGLHRQERACQCACLWAVGEDRSAGKLEAGLCHDMIWITLVDDEEDRG